MSKVSSELRLRRGEGVVHRGPGAVRRRRRHPTAIASAAGSNSGASTTQQEAPGVLVDQVAAPADLEPGRAEQGPRRPWSAPAAKKMQSPGCRADVRGQAGPLGVGEVLGDRAAERRRRPGRARRPGPGRRAAWPTPARRRAACAAGSAPPGMTTAPTYVGLEDPERWCPRSSRCTRRARCRSAGRACRSRSGSSPRRRSSAGTGVVELDADQPPQRA